jgi:hypothetical protein
MGVVSAIEFFGPNMANPAIINSRAKKPGYKIDADAETKELQYAKRPANIIG